MKKLFVIIAILTGFSGVSHAQQREQQVFSPYPQPTFMTNGAAAPVQTVEQAYQPQNNYMVYPGRETYGQNYGYIPRHPGDYRDAVDRGQWEGGGGASMPRRSFNGY